MRKVFLTGIGLVFLSLVVCYDLVHTNNGSPPAGKTNAPSEGVCTDCHNGTLNSGSGGINFIFGNNDSTFLPGETYAITIEVFDASQSYFGFQTTSLHTTNNMAGSFSLGTNTSQQSSGGRNYIGHNNAGSNNSWTFDWTAPPTDNEAVVFYIAGNAANGNGSITGDNIYAASFTIEPAEGVVNAGFMADPTQVCIGDTIQFTDTSQGNIVSWAWDFEDGNSSTDQHPTHAYNTDDTFTVQLVITDDNGNTDTATTQVIAHPTPNVDFSAADTACALEAVPFTDLSTVSNGSITDWAWDLGDGNNASTQNPLHTYDASGTYAVQLVVTTAAGCTDTASHNIWVQPKPQADFSYTTDCNDTTVYFSGSAELDDGSIAAWAWDFGDDSTSTDQQPVHAYAGYGNYTVSLMTTSDAGCTDTIVKAIEVADSTTILDFNHTTVCFGDSTAFTNLADSFTASVSWDLGDGNNSTDMHPTHLYDTTDTFQVWMTVTTNNGCTDSVMQDVYLHPLPEAAFSHTFTCFPESTAFNDQSAISSGNITGWQWDFDDGNAESGTPTPVHTYDTTGNYNVMLITTSDQGCRDTVVEAVPVHPSPEADFDFTSSCGRAVDFSDLTVVVQDSITSWSWDFGDGNTSADENPSHIFAGGDTAQVTLISTTSQGCPDTVTKAVPLKYVEAAFSPTLTCVETVTGFTDESVGNTPASWGWDFGDGNTSSQQHPTHLYESPDEYDVQLIVENNFGCRDTLIQTVSVLPFPKADFTYTMNGDTTIFIDWSENVAGYSWTFGDGNTDFVSNPTHRYASSGTYEVCLMTSNSACLDTICKDITVTITDLPTVGGRLPELQLYPNPAGLTLHVEWQMVLGGKATMQIYDMQGRIVYEGPANAPAGKRQINLSKLSPGLYHLRLVTPHGMVTKRFVRL